MTFHEDRFPTDISRQASGGPERKTTVVSLGSGYEERNSTWANSRRRYNVGYGIKSTNDLHTVIAFFEARNARLHAFRWKDWSDFKSCPPAQIPTDIDQIIATGDGVANIFQLIKSYTSGPQTHTRSINKSVAGTVLCALDAVSTTAFSVDETTGLVTFDLAPANGVTVTAGYEFDVPVRFDTDFLDVTLDFPTHGMVQAIPLVEVRI